MKLSNRGAHRRVGASVVVGALAVFGLATTSPASAIESVTQDRVAGENRFGTAAAVCEELVDAGQAVDTVVIATGRNFPDALAAAPLAAANDGCVLLVESDELPDETADELNALDPSEAIVVGGTDAVSDDVLDAIEDEGVDARRVAGANRACTAAAIAEDIGALAGSTAILATGVNAPDALAAGAIASDDTDGVMPILLASQENLPGCTEDALAEFDDVIVVGGTAAIGEATADDAGDAADDSFVERLAGATREDTAVEIAEFGVDELDWPLTDVLLAAGRPPAEVGTFSPDALVAGPLGGLLEAPILLTEGTDELGDAASGFMEDHVDTIDGVTAIGGTAVVSDGVLDDADAAATTDVEVPPEEGGGSGPAVGVPELSTAEYIRTTADGHVDIRFNFDEELDQDVGVADVSAFHIHSFDGINRVADLAEIDGSEPTSVLARFLDASGFYPGVTTAAVDADAVEADDDGDDGPANPEGEGGLQDVVFSVAETGVVSLLDIGTPVVATDALGHGIHLRVPFTFSQPAYDNGACDAAGHAYLITSVGSDGNDRLQSVGCAGDAAGVAGETTWTFLFAPNQADTDTAEDLAATVKAGQVEAGWIEDQQAVANAPGVVPLGATTSFTTVSPDLTAAALHAGATAGADDTIDFTFDETVDIIDGTAFEILYRDGSVLSSVSATHPGVDDKVVRAVFDDEALDTTEFVVASLADPDAVESIANGWENYPDQINTATLTYSDGTSMAPNLVSVTPIVLAADDDDDNPFEPIDQQAWKVTFEFDRDIDPDSFTYTDYGGTDVIDQSDQFAVYDGDGNRGDFGPVVDERYCLHDDEHGEGAELIICYVAIGDGILPTDTYQAVEDGVVATVVSNTVTSVEPPADPWNFASAVDV